MEHATQDAIGLTQQDPQTRERILGLFGQQPNQTPISFDQPIGGMTADEQMNQSVTNQVPRETIPSEESKPYEAYLDKQKLFQQAPKIEQELSDPDLPYARAAAWNAFFSNLFQKTGGKSGGLIDAIAAYGNEYGKALSKFSEQEAQYQAQRMIINQGANDAINDTLKSFDSGDETLNNIVRTLGKKPKQLEQYASDLMKTNPEQAKSVLKVANQIKGIEDTRQENLLQASQIGGKVKTVKENNGLDAEGNSVTQIVTTYENGKTRVNYVDKDGNLTTKPPKGFKTETAIKAEEDRLSRERIAAENNETRRLIASLMASKDSNKKKTGLEMQLYRIEQTQELLQNPNLNIGKGILSKGIQEVGKLVGTPDSQATAVLLNDIALNILPMVKQLGSNPSNADRIYVTNNTPDAGWSAEAIYDWLERAKRAVEFEINLLSGGQQPTSSGSPPRPTSGKKQENVIDFKDLPQRK